MSHPFEAFADRHPAAARAALVVAHLAVLTVPALTIAAVMTGHTVLGIVGVFAGIGFYACGYAAAAYRNRRRLADDVAKARRDPLTGLPNRALADEMLDAATRAGSPMTVALIDINGLHTINGNLGHAAGDQYLTTVARRLAGAVPPHGVLVRQGGDEFTLLAPYTGPQDLADRIGAAMAGPAVIAGYRMQPRAAVGIAATDAIGPVDAEHARARADSALYTAKREGGNRIRVFDPDRDPEPSADGTRPLLRRRDINPLADAVAEVGAAWLPSPGDDLVPVLLAPHELRTVVRSLAAARDRWAQATAEAQAGARRPTSPRSSDPDRINIEPTRVGYAGIADLAVQEQTRYARLLDRLDPVVEVADLLDDAGHAPPPSAGSAVSCVVLVGISAAFTPADLEALVITAAEAVHGQPDDLSSRQRELAARAHALLQDAIDD
ncbi:GGDEF domain-containing protein [Virgisporangium aurantiacum]|uniref:GGDEF domain-containing protein n=1 Tax=Virgisporangium aurantiacum TaxID=175570 RepID=A0A8J4E4K7_9ACTN|nr:GGDEF domain-containing protein [Virgisporangium aurantiacum]GIJ62050.1 hypothetical protein Vau01_095660 [Virgisporangium aurantiacum]